MSKVQSGTFAVIYELLNACAEDMDIVPMIENLRCSSPLDISDLWMTPHARVSYVSHLSISIVQILAKYVKGFEAQQTDTALQHPPRASTIEEASIDGNLLVQDDVYLVQLKHEPGNLNNLAIPTFNDQLTNARIWGGQHLHQKDISSWERREIFQLGFGSFHLAMNLLWCVLETHQGTLNQTSSLTHLFALLEKTRLGGEHPDYHTLLSALMQILHSLILNAWRIECNHSSLRNFTEANPSPDNLLTCAYRIILKYASPDPTCDDVNPKAHPKDLASGVEPKKPPVDVVHNNIVLLTRDLLCAAELIDAMATGEFGRIEDILPTHVCMFRGSGSNNYSMEILHILFNIKEVWTPAFANIIHDNMLVNPSGLPGHAMGINLNIEHLIHYLKTLFATKGIYSNWDRLGNIAAGINYLQLVKKQDTDSNTRPVADIYTLGFRKFQLVSLATFNKKLADMRQGSPTQIEIDNIAPCQVVEGTDADDTETGELSALHED
ncbi:hypothetical protein EI94DRAFT_1816167 [Lactarius quietus]|nr:hypothetical protein EI94DRAFT_1816167 [Lactarius quietus]